MALLASSGGLKSHLRFSIARGRNQSLVLRGVPFYRIPAMRALLTLAVPKQPQVDCIRQRVVAGVVWVPVVSAVVDSKDLSRGIRVTEHEIEVNHSVIF